MFEKQGKHIEKPKARLTHKYIHATVVFTHTYSHSQKVLTHMDKVAHANPLALTHTHSQ